MDENLTKQEFFMLMEAYSNVKEMFSQIKETVSGIEETVDSIDKAITADKIERDSKVISDRLETKDMINDKMDEIKPYLWGVIGTLVTVLATLAGYMMFIK